VFTGDFFGPPGTPLPVVAVGRQGDAAGGTALRATACVVVGAGHTAVRCAAPAGVGTGYAWSLSVAGQASAPSTDTTSYGPPVVTAVSVSGPGAAGGDEPGAVPTAGGAVVTLTGLNFGADASRIVLTWDGAVVPGVVVSVPHTVLSFTSLPGQGAPVNVTLTVGGQPAGSAARLPFAAPRVTALRLDNAAGTGASMDCSAVGADGRPAPGFGPPPHATVVIRGVNFGRGDATAATIGDAPCVLLAPVEDAQILCRTPLCAGVVALARCGTGVLARPSRQRQRRCWSLLPRCGVLLLLRCDFVSFFVCWQAPCAL
jgi:hypothetical protein